MATHTFVDVQYIDSAGDMQTESFEIAEDVHVIFIKTRKEVVEQ